ncbi:unnamed protein product (macronuclear) [Paramecium tetraurelia]|uniref:mRNA 5'-phosphatase n=1 Tax=Paramecium tetraurelia TaxID=5888 RepID=A0CH55_PARTE|nr:uncharacterized protein GSPATT00007562001 [Paramecium tetraurelia]CAK70122.1 unnamed protein product [Paramecium tetraurelia]|eukprot:XP_001437519.1 hypothetical protein (macronuclear) [Paramecium tetraurelia strain d4-2]
MNKDQLIKWIQNVIKTKIMKKEDQTIFELEAKIGKFKGQNVHANKYLQSIKGMEQLDKNNSKYQFESKINLKQYNNAYEYLKQKENQVVIKRLDFSLNKQQRNSFQIINNQISAVLIEKQKNLQENIDIINDKIHFRISLNQEKTLSKSLKDIIAQMPSRKQHANFIRLKQTLFINENHLEFALSKVSSIVKYDPEFQKILDEISSSKCINIQNKLEQIFKDQNLTDYEFEIEIAQIKDFNDEQIEQLSKDLIHQIDVFWGILNFNQVEDEQKPEKKVRLNENE